MNRPGLRRFLFLPLFVVLLVSCGRKAPPRWVQPEAPPAPSMLTAISRGDAVALKWNYPEGGEVALKGFSVMRSRTGPRGEFLEIGRAKERSYIDRDVDADAVYTYKIKALGDRIASESSNPVEAALTTGLESPRGLRVDILKETLELSWEYPEGGLFNIYKSDIQGDYPLDPLNPEPIVGRSFRDVLAPEAPFYYTVRAVEGISGMVTREGPPSRELSVGPEDYVPSVPTGLGAAVAEGKVLLYWDETPETWVRGYRVYRALGDGEFKEIGSSKTPAFKDPEDIKEKRRYRVSAQGPAMGSPLSEPVDISP